VGSALSPQSNHSAVELMRLAADASSVAQRA
jgi:hypothetical protein